MKNSYYHALSLGMKSIRYLHSLLNGLFAIVASYHAHMTHDTRRKSDRSAKRRVEALEMITKHRLPRLLPRKMPDSQNACMNARSRDVWIECNHLHWEKGRIETTPMIVALGAVFVLSTSEGYTSLFRRENRIIIVAV